MGFGSQLNQTSDDEDLHAVVQCLLTAHYNESEIVDYLEGPFGVSPEAALRVVRAAVGQKPR